MGFSCSICQETLEELPSEVQGRQGRGGPAVRRGSPSSRPAPDVISAIPCGHVFHTHCIQKWVTRTPTGNRLCPCCRKPIPGVQCLIPLFLNMDDIPSDGSASAQAELVASLQRKVAQLEEEYKDMSDLNVCLSSDNEGLTELLLQEKVESEGWMLKCKQFESYKDVANDYKQVADKANKLLEDCKKELTSQTNKLTNVTAELTKTTEKLSEVSINFDRIKSENMRLKTQTKELTGLRELYTTIGEKTVQLRNKLQEETRAKALLVMKVEEFESNRLGPAPNLENEALGEVEEGSASLTNIPPTTSTTSTSYDSSEQSLVVQRKSSLSRKPANVLQELVTGTGPNGSEAGGSSMRRKSLYDKEKLLGAINDFQQMTEIFKSFGRVQNTSPSAVSDSDNTKSPAIAISACASTSDYTLARSGLTGLDKGFGPLWSSLSENATRTPQARAAALSPIQDIPSIPERACELETGFLRPSKPLFERATNSGLFEKFDFGLHRFGSGNQLNAN